MAGTIRVTEYLNLNLEHDTWECNHCGHHLITSKSNYKEGCLVYNRDPQEIHPPLVEHEYSFSPDPRWIRIIEFYCPSCATQIETEYLPPGHPLTYDIEIDLDSLKERLAKGELEIIENRLVSKR